jgi:predicted nucleic acid-binding protein
MDTNLLVSAIIKPTTLPGNERIDCLSHICNAADFILPQTHTITACRDPKDNKFLELAFAANASCIITGDKDLLILHPFKNIPIVSASDFLKSY